MGETVTFDAGKDYELAIPQWNAVVVPSWSMEISTTPGEWEPATGTILVKEGDGIRSTHAPLMQTMLDQGFIRERIHDDHSQ